ncbi:MAG: hypothetical protein IKB88_09035 [Clostridia bacterium]|nr:hypothetical protein [Clostridia bacterium]
MGFLSAIIGFFQLLMCIFFGAHNYTEATCTEASKCVICGDIKEYATGHKYADGECIYCGEEDNYYGPGETWIVDGQWEVTVNSAKRHFLCDTYANNRHGYTDEQIVLVEYTYKNIGYTSSLGLFVAPDYYDELMVKAQDYTCLCGNLKFPDWTPIGATCKVVQSIVLENDSDEITVAFSEYGNNTGRLNAMFTIPVEGEIIDNNQNKPEYKTFGLGETWVVDDQWELTVNSAKTHRFCNSYENEREDFTGKKLVLVTYTYKNLGYYDEKYDDGLFITPDNCFDESLMVCDTYIGWCNEEKYAKTIPVGATCIATELYVVDDDCDEVTINFEFHNDKWNKKYITNFRVPVDGGNNNNSGDANIKKFKDHCKNYGSYSGGEYVVRQDMSSSSYGTQHIFKMYYNPTTDKLRFEDSYSNPSSSTKLTVWVDENGPTHKWEYEYKFADIYMKGSGNVKKNENLSVSSIAELESIMNVTEFYEKNGEPLTSRDRDIFLSSSSSAIETLPFTLDGYFMGRGMTILDSSCFGFGTRK